MKICLTACAFLLCLLTHAQEKGKLNPDSWENVTNGKGYYEKSVSKPEGSATSGEKKHGNVKTEGDNGYDPEYREPERNYREEESGFRIPATVSYVLIAIVLLALVLFIVYTAQGVKTNTQLETSKISEERLQEIEENPFENDLERMIYEALQSKNYKLAIRLQFIYVVRLLSENGLINWKKHKTNSAYARELRKHAFSSKYNHLNLLFEHVWYGNWDLNAKVLKEINGSFDDSVTHLKNLKKS